MLHDHQLQKRDASEEWAVRSEFWSEIANAMGGKRKRRARNPAPLILCGHGVSLRVEQGALVIRDGFTHYPQQQASYRFFRGGLDIPQRIMILDGSGTLSFDVLSWLTEQGVALARVKWTGEVAAVASGSGYAADPKKVRWQHDMRGDEERRLAFSRDLIGRKLANSITTLKEGLGSPANDAAIARVQLCAKRLGDPELCDVAALRGIEGDAAVAYFRAWRDLEIRWKGTERRPIPAEWQRFTARGSLTTGVKAKNRDASHPINAMLNYAYAVKLAHLQIQTVAEGYDPTSGIMHHAREGLPAFVCDLIEPGRPKVDAAVLAFVRSRHFCADDFVIRKDGACRLSPQLARVVASLQTS